MTLGRLRSGEILAGAGAVVLFVVLFLDWFEPGVKPRVTETSGRVIGPEQHLAGWTSLGWVMLVLLLAVIVLVGAVCVVGLLALDRLEAQVRLSRLAGGFLRLAAELSADVTQACVVTLEPVRSRIEEEFTLLYSNGPEEKAGEVVLSGSDEVVEPLSEGSLDIGEAVAQQLSLALDPFPRAPGAELPGEAAPEAPERVSPFAALAALRTAKGK
jgi:uncharacterized metal-binding protein YceD (DUF177 family)